MFRRSALAAAQEISLMGPESSLGGPEPKVRNCEKDRYKEREKIAA